MIWSQLPNQISIHFNAAGQANNFQSKALAVFGLPKFSFSLVHLFVTFYDRRDPKNCTMNEEMVALLVDSTVLNRLLSLSIAKLGSTTNPSVFVSGFARLTFADHKQLHA